MARNCLKFVLRRQRERKAPNLLRLDRSGISRMFLISAFLIIIPSALTPYAAKAFRPAQDPHPLTLRQIEQLIDNGIEDEVVAREINESGLAFRVQALTLEQLVKRGAGALTRRALLHQEE